MVLSSNNTWREIEAQINNYLHIISFDKWKTSKLEIFIKRFV